MGVLEPSDLVRQRGRDRDLFRMLVFDITMSGLILPKILIPAIAAYPRGLLTQFNFSMALTPGLGVGVSCIMLASLVHILFQRHQTILPPGHRRKFRKIPKRIFAFLMYGLFSPTFVFMTVSGPPNPDETKREIAKVRETSTDYLSVSLSRSLYSFRDSSAFRVNFLTQRQSSLVWLTVKSFSYAVFSTASSFSQWPAF